MEIALNGDVYCAPVTAAGTVRRKAVTVAKATCCGVARVLQLCPGVTMFGFSKVPSKYT